MFLFAEAGARWLIRLAGKPRFARIGWSRNGNMEGLDSMTELTPEQKQSAEKIEAEIRDRMGTPEEVGEILDLMQTRPAMLWHILYSGIITHHQTLEAVREDEEKFKSFVQSYLGGFAYLIDKLEFFAKRFPENNDARVLRQVYAFMRSAMREYIPKNEVQVVGGGLIDRFGRKIGGAS